MLGVRGCFLCFHLQPHHILLGGWVGGIRTKVERTSYDNQDTHLLAAPKQELSSSFSSSPFHPNAPHFSGRPRSPLRAPPKLGPTPACSRAGRLKAFPGDHPGWSPFHSRAEPSCNLRATRPPGGTSRIPRLCKNRNKKIPTSWKKLKCAQSPTSLS